MINMKTTQNLPLPLPEKYYKTNLIRIAYVPLLSANQNASKQEQIIFSKKFHSWDIKKFAFDYVQYW